MAEGFSTLVDGLSFTECPRWHNDGRLYFSDFYTHRVLSVNPDGSGLEEIAHVPGQPAGLGFLPDGRLLIVSMVDRRILRRERDGSLHLHADLHHLAPWHLNDMLVDFEGRAWVGNFGFDLHGGADAADTVLISVDPDGSARVAAEGLAFPNGTVLTPDGRTLIVAETTGNRLTAFDIEDGRLVNRRVWASFGPPPQSRKAMDILMGLEVLPDGICLDAEGAIWVTDPIHMRILRVAEGGRILAELQMPGMPAWACVLGGGDGRTLFTCCSKGFSEEENKKARNASLCATRVEAPRAGLP